MPTTILEDPGLSLGVVTRVPVLTGPPAEPHIPGLKTLTLDTWVEVVASVVSRLAGGPLTLKCKC